jgi:phosphoribosylformylglycinamidine cyclo-ligase
MEAWPKSIWKRCLLPVFGWLQDIGGTPEREMLRTFNCGIGMIIVVKAKDAKAVAAGLKKSGEKVVMLGALRKRTGKETQVATTGSLKVQ